MSNREDIYLNKIKRPDFQFNKIQFDDCIMLTYENYLITIYISNDSKCKDSCSFSYNDNDGNKITKPIKSVKYGNHNQKTNKVEPSSQSIYTVEKIIQTQNKLAKSDICFNSFKPNNLFGFHNFNSDLFIKALKKNFDFHIIENKSYMDDGKNDGNVSTKAVSVNDVILNVDDNAVNNEEGVNNNNTSSNNKSILKRAFNRLRNIIQYVKHQETLYTVGFMEGALVYKPVNINEIVDVDIKNKIYSLYIYLLVLMFENNYFFSVLNLDDMYVNMDSKPMYKDAIIIHFNNIIDFDSNKKNEILSKYKSDIQSDIQSDINFVKLFNIIRTELNCTINDNINISEINDNETKINGLVNEQLTNNKKKLILGSSLTKGGLIKRHIRYSKKHTKRIKYNRRRKLFNRTKKRTVKK